MWLVEVTGAIVGVLEAWTGIIFNIPGPRSRLLT